MLHVLRVEDAAGCFILTDRYADDREAAVSNLKKNIFKTGCSLFFYAGGGGVLPYIGHIGMCPCEGYGFQAFYSSIGYINQGVWV